MFQITSCRHFTLMFELHSPSRILFIVLTSLKLISSCWRDVDASHHLFYATFLCTNCMFLSRWHVDCMLPCVFVPLYPCSASRRSILVMGLKSTSHSRMQPSRPPVANPSSQACMLKIPAWTTHYIKKCNVSPAQPVLTVSFSALWHCDNRQYCGHAENLEGNLKPKWSD